MDQSNGIAYKSVHGHASRKERRFGLETLIRTARIHSDCSNRLEWLDRCADERRSNEPFGMDPQTVWPSKTAGRHSKKTSRNGSRCRHPAGRNSRPAAAGCRFFKRSTGRFANSAWRLQFRVSPTGRQIPSPAMKAAGPRGRTVDAGRPRDSSCSPAPREPPPGRQRQAGDSVPGPGQSQRPSCRKLRHRRTPAASGPLRIGRAEIFRGDNRLPPGRQGSVRLEGFGPLRRSRRRCSKTGLAIGCRQV